MSTKKFLVYFGMLFALAILPFVIAAGVTQTDIFFNEQNQAVNNVRSILYTCTNVQGTGEDIVCAATGTRVHDLNSGSTNRITFEYPYVSSATATNPTYYGHYLYRDCYLPKDYVEWVWGHDASVEYEYEFRKAKDCHSPIDSFSVTNTNYANEPITINVEAALEADAYSAFTDYNQGTAWYPSGMEEYYSAETRVTLEILNSAGSVVYTDTEIVDLYMDTSENVQFRWTPTTAGQYTARVKTNVIDCQCSSNFEQSSQKIFTVLTERPTNECYTIINDLTATPQFAFEGDRVTVRYNKISNYANSNHVLTAVPTRVTYEITNSNNAIVYSDSQLISANSGTTTPREVSFTWTPSASGNYNIRVTGICESTLCAGKTNTPDTAILGFFVDKSEPPVEETYDVSFIVRNAYTTAVLSGATVTFGSKTATSNSLGRANFNDVKEGTYNWEVSLADYETETGSIYIGQDRTIIVNLFPVEEPPVEETYDVTFIVTESGTGDYLQNVAINFDSRSASTNAQGRVVFSDVDEGQYSWTASLAGYQTATGSQYISGDETICITLTPLPTENYTVIFNVRDSETDKMLSGALVELGSRSALTNSQGRITFSQVIVGTYNWEVSLAGYESENGTIFVNQDKIVNVELTPLEVPVVTEVEVIYPNGGENVSGDINIRWNATNSAGHELSIRLYYSPNNGSTWTAIDTNTENDGIYTWNTETVPDRETYLIRVGARDSVTCEIVYDQSDDVFTIFNAEEEEDDDEEKSKSHSSSSRYFSCIPEWDCSAWSECVDGVKTRTCVDLNECGVFEDQPIEISGCADEITGYSTVAEDGRNLTVWIIVLAVVLILLLVLLALLLRQ